MRRIKIFIPLALSTGLLLSGCASESGNTEIADLKKQLYELQKAQGIEVTRIEELNNKVLLLKDQVDNKAGSPAMNDELPPPPVQAPAPSAQVPVKPQIQAEQIKPMVPLPPDDEDAGSQAEPTVELKPAHGVASKNDVSAEKLYGQAVTDAKKNETVFLEKDVNKLLKGHKESPLTNNALFLLAETLYQHGEFAKSASEYERLYKLFPDGNKAVASLFRLGLCYQKLGRYSEAKEAFQNVMTVYPGSHEAIEAQKILQESGEKGT